MGQSLGSTRKPVWQKINVEVRIMCDTFCDIFPNFSKNDYIFSLKYFQKHSHECEVFVWYSLILSWAKNTGPSTFLRSTSNYFNFYPRLFQLQYITWYNKISYKRFNRLFTLTLLTNTSCLILFNKSMRSTWLVSSAFWSYGVRGGSFSAGVSESIVKAI